MKPDTTRRTFLLAGLGFLAGCATTGSRTRLPDVPWSSSRSPGSGQPPRTDFPTYEPSTPPTTATVRSTQTFGGAIPRSSWATGAPIPTRMDPLTGVYRITLHHDGMTPFTSTSQGDAAARIDTIRRAHQSKGWGDVGYHFVVDPAGRVWEGRLLQFQGAHVKDQNPGNIGIVCLGNFELQTPSPAQISAMRDFVCRVQGAYRIPNSRVQTHRELAATLCPGAAMQVRVNQLRQGGAFS